MKKIIIALALIITAMQLHAQDKFYTKTGKINFDATVPASPEKIEGVNKSVTCVLDTKTGNFQFSLLMKGFQFERALMEEHFNENYVESSKYPKAEFKGIISNNAAVNYSKDGTYAVKVKGKLSMHGETRDLEADGKITIKDGKINTAANFNIPFGDYKIAIPTLVSDKVAKTANINVDCSLDPLK
jgi:polyisoprenoid-binding protein YceI